MNIGSLINLVKSGGNPQQMVCNMLEGMANNNPVAQNVMNLVNTNQYNQLETIARNLCKSKNINPDDMINNIKKTYGI